MYRALGATESSKLEDVGPQSWGYFEIQSFYFDEGKQFNHFNWSATNNYILRVNV